MIRLICPGCEKILQVKDTLAGRVIACPSCKIRFQVPSLEPAPAAPPAEKPPSASRKTLATVAEDDDRDPPPRKRRDEGNEDRPRRRPRPDDDEDDDRPRRRRGEDDLDDEDDDDDRPRPRAKKKRKKKVRSSGGGGGGFAEWSPTAKILSISAVIWALCFGLGFIWPPLVIGAFAVGIILSIVGSVMFLIVVIEDDIVQLLLCLFIPFYSLYYLITHFEECKQSFFLQLAGTGFVMVSMCAGIGAIAITDKANPPPPPQFQKAELRLPFPAVELGRPA